MKKKKEKDIAREIYRVNWFEFEKKTLNGIYLQTEK